MEVEEEENKKTLTSCFLVVGSPKFWKYSYHISKN